MGTGGGDLKPHLYHVVYTYTRARKKLAHSPVWYKQFGNFYILEVPIILAVAFVSRSPAARLSLAHTLIKRQSCCYYYYYYYFSRHRNSHYDSHYNVPIVCCQTRKPSTIPPQPRHGRPEQPARSSPGELINRFFYDHMSVPTHCLRGVINADLIFRAKRRKLISPEKDDGPAAFCERRRFCRFILSPWPPRSIICPYVLGRRIIYWPYDISKNLSSQKADTNYFI